MDRDSAYSHCSKYNICLSPPLFQAVCQEPRKSDVYHLAVNLLDRYLSYETVESEREFLAISGASAMISMKIRRARKECLNYDQLRYHFSISERSIRVSACTYNFTLQPSTCCIHCSSFTLWLLYCMLAYF